MELAEKDMSAWKTWKELVRVELTECKLINIMMQTLQGQEDKFHRVNIPDSNKSVIIYSNYDTNYLPSCIEIKNIEIEIVSTGCYKHIPVRIAIQNTTLDLFLENDNILRYSSEVTSCKRRQNKIMMENKQLTIITAENNTIKIKYNSSYIIFKHR